MLAIMITAFTVGDCNLKVRLLLARLGMAPHSSTCYKPTLILAKIFEVLKAFEINIQFEIFKLAYNNQPKYYKITANSLITNMCNPCAKAGVILV